MEGRMDGSPAAHVALWPFLWPCGPVGPCVALCGRMAGWKDTWQAVGHLWAILWPCGKLWQAVPCAHAVKLCCQAVEAVAEYAAMLWKLWHTIP